MKRTFAFALLAAVTSFAPLPDLRAEDNVSPRGNLFFSPGNSSGTVYRNRQVEVDNQAKQEVSDRNQEQRQLARPPLLENMREPLRRRPLFFRRSDRQFATPPTPTDLLAANPVSQRPPDVPWSNRATPVSRPTASAVPVSQSGQQVVVRPVTYGMRVGLGSMYPAAIFGQTAPSSPQPGTSYPAAGGAAPGYPMSINPEKYSYASRSNGACCDGTGYSPVYNSGYYTSGCYQSNACCRTSRRQCTLFGGLFRGCGSGCYSPPPPPCSTTCYADPCSAPMGGTYYAPPAYGTPTPIPSTTPTPPAPGNPVENVAPPQPIEKKVTPEPQAKLSPRIPGLPPDA